MEMRVKLVLAVAVIIVLIASPVCFAAQKSTSGTQSTQKVNCLNKMKDGLTNVLTGWTEVPRKISETYGADKNIFEALTIGTLKGVMYAFGRTAAGAVDTVFFFIPPYDKPLVEPLYNP